MFPQAIRAVREAHRGKAAFSPSISKRLFDRYRQVANRKPILVIDGVMQRQDGVWSILATHIQALEGVPRPSQRSHDYR